MKKTLCILFVLITVTFSFVSCGKGNGKLESKTWYADNDSSGYIEMTFKSDGTFQGKKRNKSDLLISVIPGENRDGTPITTTSTTRTTFPAEDVVGTWTLDETTNTLYLNTNWKNGVYYWTDISGSKDGGCWNLSDGVLTVNGKTYHK